MVMQMKGISVSLDRKCQYHQLEDKAFLKSMLEAREEGQVSGGGGICAYSYAKTNSLNGSLLLGSLCGDIYF